MIISPEDFDLIVIGTGLVESVVASSAALAGKSVLHLDKRNYYGDEWAGLDLDEFLEHLGSDSDMVYNLEVTQRKSEKLQGSKDYVIDLAPKVTYQSELLLEALVRTQAHNYVDYKLVDANLILTDQGLVEVPSSRPDIFKSKTLTPIQKRSLTLFLRQTISLIENLDKEQLEDFDEWIDKQQLDSELSLLIKKAVSFSDDQPDNAAKFEAMGLYLLSAGRLKSSSGPFLVPLYTSSDIPQGFCRLCAVHGGVHVLNCDVKQVDISDKSIEIVTQYDQKIRGAKLCFPAGECRKFSHLWETDLPELKQESVSRCVCILDRSMVAETNQIFVVVPRGDKPSTYFLQVTSPDNKIVLYGYCRGSTESATKDLSEDLHRLLVMDGTQKPDVLFECYYNQIQFSFNSNAHPSTATCPSPKGIIGYTQEINSAKSIFESLFPDDQFLQAKSRATREDSDDEKYAALENELSQLNH